MLRPRQKSSIGSDSPFCCGSMVSSPDVNHENFPTKPAYSGSPTDVKTPLPASYRTVTPSIHTLFLLGRTASALVGRAENVTDRERDATINPVIPLTHPTVERLLAIMDQKHHWA